ncbi:MULTISPECIES: cytochrome-c peroxidase [Methylomonas]|uniref:Cytochrome-c peroxidase n=2 Tax=Methylomonas TaxID=416 RepID=A0A140E491_9GAMM|nr:MULTISPECIES: cytochrome c peroxidase [Methylomonas]AMK75215.1 cytochrome-c peroxidase [Methylomonas denitrificans]OAH99389.1 cytochrome-c peroxidase [Methylomonas methanica]TCV85037.1 cytochrome c peroxidase [Methylomonas methanica]
MRYLWMILLAGLAVTVQAQEATKPVTPLAQADSGSADNLLGLPPVPIPADNPQTPAKIALGDKLFHDKRFSIDGTVSCANCHDDKKAFTDNLPVSVGHHGLTGTRNAPTVINAAFYKSQFWDGREPSLEGQSKGPFVNPVEGGLPNHQVLLDIIRADADYPKAFKEVFGVDGQKVTIDHVAKAIASFERTVVAGNSPFDRFYFKGDKTALTEQQQRGFKLFLEQGRCVSCHIIEQNQALFTDSRFHNIGVGISAVQQDITPLVQAFLDAKNKGGDVDKIVLTDKKSSELGRFAVSDALADIGGFKTPTLRNIALTAPYMHDGSLKTLKEVVIHYNNGGVTPASAKPNDFLSGGIRPLNLTDAQIDDLVAFLQSLTSAQYSQAGK